MGGIHAATAGWRCGEGSAHGARRPPCPWRLQDLPPGALGMNDWYMDNADSLQDRLELVQTIVVSESII